MANNDNAVLRLENGSAQDQHYDARLIEGVEALCLELANDRQALALLQRVEARAAAGGEAEREEEGPIRKLASLIQVCIDFSRGKMNFLRRSLRVALEFHGGFITQSERRNLCVGHLIDLLRDIYNASQKTRWTLSSYG